MKLLTISINRSLVPACVDGNLPVKLGATYFSPLVFVAFSSLLAQHTRPVREGLTYSGVRLDGKIHHRPPSNFLFTPPSRRRGARIAPKFVVPGSFPHPTLYQQAPRHLILQVASRRDTRMRFWELVWTTNVSCRTSISKHFSRPLQLLFEISIPHTIFA